MKNKSFDCVEMKHRGAAQVLAETAGMTPEQEIEYWRAATETLRDEQRRTLASRSVQQLSPARTAP